MTTEEHSDQTRSNAPPPGFTYLPDFLRGDEEERLLTLVRGLPYKRDRFRGRPLKRGYAQFGFAYVSTGRRLLPAPPLPHTLAAVAERGRVFCPEGTEFDQCIVTHYPDGAGIGWHTDAPCFGDVIMAVSLGAPARLQLRRHGAEEVACEVLAAPGSLYVLRDEARWEYDHQVVAVDAERYSITYRSVVGIATEERSRRQS